MREERSHIKDKDFLNIKKIKNIPINLEIGATKKMLNIAMKQKPNFTPRAQQAISQAKHIAKKYNSPIITFNNSKDLTDTVAFIPTENLLVETDSPYLAPVPFRGKPNEPSYIIHTIEKISRIKKTSKEKIISCTTHNFKKLFEIN